jgi:hypothetical protein
VATVDVIIAARLSQKAKGRKQTGIESQDEDAREWAKEQGHSVIETVADHASGTKAMWQRKNLRPWVTDPDLMTKYQAIVAAKQDRLSRADWRDEAELRMWAENNHKVLFIVDRDLRWPPREGAHHDDDVTNWNRGAEESHREWNNTSNRYKRMHKTHARNNELTGRPPYGYRVVGIDCGKSPCRCWENGIEDGKTLAIYEPEASVIREARDRYLNGESTTAICANFDARSIPSPVWKGEPGKRWRDTTLGKILRNPATAGRRMDNFDKGLRNESERKTILTYPGILTWREHEQIVARLDSRAHRAGIAPYNVTLLTGIIFDDAGHPMYRTRSRNREDQYMCRKGCGVSVPISEMDDRVNEAVIEKYGYLPHMVRRIIPGKNHFEEISRLRQDRKELDDLADDYDERTAAITAEIRRLSKEDKEHPQPDRIKWVETDQTIAEYWQSLDTPKRHDWLKENGWKVVPYKSDGRWMPRIDPGYTVQILRSGSHGLRLVAC